MNFFKRVKGALFQVGRQKLIYCIFVSLLAAACVGTVRISDHDLEDFFKGSPFKQAYKRSYDNAIAEGLSPEEAHRRALLVGADHDRKVQAERRHEERSKEIFESW